ncbi:MAG: quinone-dependent dihydroorotate dehydrogenase [Labilithrix sp.]|nr:quinone-dependent dihydroorotate dehydrogenase [Labilithrix sp.]
MYTLLKRLLFGLEPARAHNVAMKALGPAEHLGAVRTLMRGALCPTDPRLRVRKMGLEFPTPVGLAAGFDKNAERARALASLGFGHVELGTVTAEAQAPNPAPNLFRLPKDRALVNRLGFPNEGAARVAERIAERRKSVKVPIGISIGKSRSVPLEPLSGVLDDYRKSFNAVRGVADFVVINVSSPNTKDLRAMQAAETARPLFEALRKEDGAMPILVKIAPDLTDEAIDAIVDEAKRAGLAGVVATNTTISREHLLTPPDVVEKIGPGGLSGWPLFARSVSVVRRVRARIGPDACVIGVGGVDGAETTLAMLRVGADLVQVYTGFIYRGPMLPRKIAQGLVREMNKEGATSLADLVRGAAHTTNGAAAAHA